MITTRRKIKKFEHQATTKEALPQSVNHPFTKSLASRRKVKVLEDSRPPTDVEISITPDAKPEFQKSNCAQNAQFPIVKLHVLTQAQVPPTLFHTTITSAGLSDDPNSVT